MADTEHFYDTANRRNDSRKTISGDETKSAVYASKVGTTAGRGLGSQSDSFVPPKQNAGEDSGAYGARVARAREAFRQRKAMR